MSWKDRLQKAKFRDVPFHVETADGELGRRAAVHEYPLRDRPYVEDLGRKARQFTMDAFVLGADYMALRDRMIQALEMPGTGTLVHPYLGSMTVSVVEAKLKESTAEGGMARFLITFIESGNLEFPTAVDETAAAVLKGRDYAQEAVMANWLRRYAVKEKPEFVADSSRTLLTSVLEAVQGASKVVGAQADQVAALARDIQDVNRDLVSIIYTPASVAQALVANIKQLVSNVTDSPRDAFGLARVFFRFGDSWPDVTGATPSRQQQAENQAGYQQLVRTAAVSEGAVQASAMTFESYQDAIAVRDELVDAIDAIAEADDTSDDLFQGLRALRTAVVRDIQARGADLARLVTYMPSKTMPALVLAHRLYGDATRADEIIARNRIRHPGFVPGAVALEVLTDD